ncbi:MAG: insulinase family protein [Brucellaceae bacterium]|nr:insulinase family protein [Brucellaceae bacterium]
MTITLRFLAAMISTVLLAVAPARAETGPDVESFTLDNGLQVVVIPDHRAPVVTHMVWYKVGSADEQPGKSGIAHFFEHLMFKATKNHPAGAFSQAVADIGGEENAFTSYDYTAYYQKVAPQALGTMMAFEADRMVNLVLNDEVVATERDVIIEERNSRIDNEPRSLMGEELNATLYQNHPYRIPVIGWMHEIRKLNLDDAVAFYKRYYEPNNAVLVVAGDTDAATVRRLAEDTYGRIPRGPDLPPRERPTEPPQETARTVTLTDARITRPSFSRSWLVPSYDTAKPGEAEALDLMSEILGGGVRSRIYQDLVVKDQLAASAGANYGGDAMDVGTFSVWGTPRDGVELKTLQDAVDAQIALIAKSGVTDEELEKAKNRFLKSVLFARDSQSSMARIYGASLATGSTLADIAEWPDRIRAVTPQAVQDAAQRHLTAQGTVTGYLLPPQEQSQ